MCLCAHGHVSVCVDDCMCDCVWVCALCTCVSKNMCVSVSDCVRVCVNVNMLVSLCTCKRVCVLACECVQESVAYMWVCGECVVSVCLCVFVCS